MRLNPSEKIGNLGSIYARGLDLLPALEERRVSIGSACVAPSCKNAVGRNLLQR